MEVGRVRGEMLYWDGIANTRKRCSNGTSILCLDHALPNCREQVENGVERMKCHQCQDKKGNLYREDATGDKEGK
jgi:hypothetical protein